MIINIGELFQYVDDKELDMIGCRIMTLELLESTDLDYIDFWCIYRGGSRISGKGVHMYKMLDSLF